MIEEEEALTANPNPNLQVRVQQSELQPLITTLCEVAGEVDHHAEVPPTWVLAVLDVLPGSAIENGKVSEPAKKMWVKVHKSMGHSPKVLKLLRDRGYDARFLKHCDEARAECPECRTYLRAS